MRGSFSTFILAIAIIISSFSATHAHDDIKHDRMIERDRERRLLAHDELYGSNQIRSLDKVRSANLAEHQVLIVKTFAYIAGQSKHSSQNTVTDSHLDLKITGNSSPSSDVEQVWITFWPEIEKLPKPSYSASAKRIKMHFPLSKHRSVDLMLRTARTVYAQFRAYANGHLWADLHTEHIEVGLGH